MADPMTPDQIVRQMKKWGIPFVETDGWRTRNRNHVGSWGPVHGFMVHHTGDDAPDRVDLQVIIRGRTDLPGPLAQFGCGDDGTIYLIGNGRANHAGGGDPGVLSAVMNQRYGDYPPPTHEHTGSDGSVDGNSRFYGVEAFYSGKALQPAARRSLILLAAAICDFHGWTPKAVIGHKEWSDWKVDPGHVDMKVFRAAVEQALKDGPPADELVQHLRRAARRLDDAREMLERAAKNMDEAIALGAEIRPMKVRTREMIIYSEEFATRLRGLAK